MIFVTLWITAGSGGHGGAVRDAAGADEPCGERDEQGVRLQELIRRLHLPVGGRQARVHETGKHDSGIQVKVNEKIRPIQQTSKVIFFLDVHLSSVSQNTPA